MEMLFCSPQSASLMFCLQDVPAAHTQELRTGLQTSCVSALCTPVLLPCFVGGVHHQYPVSRPLGVTEPAHGRTPLLPHVGKAEVLLCPDQFSDLDHCATRELRSACTSTSVITAHQSCNVDEDEDTGLPNAQFKNWSHNCWGEGFGED